MSVVVITRRHDPTADLVILRLAARGVPVTRFDVGDFPQSLTVAGHLASGTSRWTGTIVTEHRTIELADVDAVWYRKPTRFVFDPAMTATERAWATREAKAGLGGLLAVLPAKWVNHPHLISAAERKPVNLSLAGTCGLTLADTLLTSDAAEAEAFCADHPGGVVYKSLRGGPRTENGQLVALYTTSVTAVEITKDVAHTMHLFQERIHPKAFEVRLTVVGENMGLRGRREPEWTMGLGPPVTRRDRRRPGRRTARNQPVTTTLDPAAPWRAELVRTLVERVVLTDPAWREAFATVPREVFVPRFARREQGGQLVHYDHAAEGGAVDFLAAVYSDTSLITRFNAAGIATSSSSQPSLMAIMLDRLDIQEGDTVLEIGAGTGYHAALLAHCLGNDAVTTIDVDSDIVLEAEHALAHAGYHPTVVCGNGAAGVPARAPFDRIIATCGVSRIPKAWIAQTRPGGKIVANISFGLIVLTVTADGTAIGQFDTEPAAFMRLHDEPADTTPSIREVLAMAHGDGATRTTTIRPQLDYPMTRPVIDFLVALILPGIRRTLLLIDPPTHVLVDPVSGSWARAHADGDAAVVIEHGPRVLWDELSTVITEWVKLGQPEVSDYSLTIDAAGTHHLHHPESGWTLALP